jgi:PHD/YefM family antitoxin component YafN of YafNO toxin-antitoxin module
VYCNTVPDAKTDFTVKNNCREEIVLTSDNNFRRLVYELEKKNAEIMREIARLRQNRASVQVGLSRIEHLFR